MADKSHAEDTTFVVAEPDFVFFREDAEAWPGYLSQNEAETQTFQRFSEMAFLLEDIEERNQFLHELEEYMTSWKKDKNAPWPKADKSKRSRDDAGHKHWTEDRFYCCEYSNIAFSRPKKNPPSAFRPENISPHLLDLQALMTAASRRGRDGFLWCGWNVCQWASGDQKSKGDHKTSPRSGAQLSMMTTKCARELLPVWHAEPDSHMGRFFYEKLGLEWQERFGCAYVWPPIGGFFTHESKTCSTDPMTRRLKSHFDNSWCQAGTRKMNDDQVHRWICAFTDKGPVSCLGDAEVQLPEQLVELRWTTQCPPGTPEWGLGWRYYHEGKTPEDKPQTEESRYSLGGSREV